MLRIDRYLEYFRSPGLIPLHFENPGEVFMQQRLPEIEKPHKLDMLNIYIFHAPSKIPTSIRRALSINVELGQPGQRSWGNRE